MKLPWSRDDYQREFADEIIRQIERGVAPWQKPWKPGERGSPENFHTGKSYTGGNNIYLAVRGVKKGYGDNRWGTYRGTAQIAAKISFKLLDQRRTPVASMTASLLASLSTATLAWPGWP